MKDLNRLEPYKHLGEECGVFGMYDFDGGDVADSIYYDCEKESDFSLKADVAETNCVYYAAGTEDPDFQDVDGYMLTAMNPVYENVGWRAVPEPAVFALLLALAALRFRER